MEAEDMTRWREMTSAQPWLLGLWPLWGNGWRDGADAMHLCKRVWLVPVEGASACAIWKWDKNFEGQWKLCWLHMRWWMWEQSLMQSCMPVRWHGATNAPVTFVSEGMEIRVWVSGMRSEGIEFQKPLDRGSRGQSSTYHPKNETSKSAQWPKIISLSCFTCRFTVIVLGIYACEKNIEKHQTVSSLLCKHKEMALCRLWYSRRKYLENRCQARSDDAGSKGDQS